MREIGGYFEIEKNRGEEYYNYLRFNSSRNSLQFIIRKRNIKKIYLPYYLCLSIQKVLKQENVEIIYYHINNNFEPIIEDYDEKIYVYLVNFFGLLSKETLQKLNTKFRNMILDNTHSFFMKGFGNIDIIYNCRKYFGVPDGSYLYTDLDDDTNFQQASSMSRIQHLFGRYETKAQQYYSDFSKSEETFENQEIEKMSKITQNMLKGVNYQFVLNRRIENFKYLNEKLKGFNFLKNIETNFAYPLLIENGKIVREKLIKEHVYIPKLWPELNQFPLNEFEKNIYINLILLPIDQRYNIDDMKYIYKIIKEKING